MKSTAEEKSSTKREGNSLVVNTGDMEDYLVLGKNEKT